MFFISSIALDSPFIVTTVQNVLNAVTADRPLIDTETVVAPAKYELLATDVAVMICLFRVTLVVPLANAEQYTTPANAAASSNDVVRVMALRVLVEEIATIMGADNRNVGAAVRQNYIY